jgi:ABC-type Fe3+/spermidine/putrescine transport system ATPase subunit
MTGLSVRGLTVQRGRRLVLEDVSFTAVSGGITAVLGPACAGKTSLLAAIAGLLPAERGAIFRGADDVAGLAPRKRGIGLLPPGSALPEARSTGAALSRLGGRRSGEVVAPVFQALDLGFTGTPPEKLSHGEQFLALAAARLFPSGDVLLVDEAGIGLDEPGIGRIIAHLRREVLGGRTVLMATRSSAIACLADHVVLLVRGQVVQAGAPSRVYDEPRCEVAARLTGGANIFQGRIRELRSGGFVWAAGGGGRFVQYADPDMPRPTLGADVTLCVRPERMALLAGNEIADNMVEGEVADVRCAGPTFDVWLNSTLGELRVAVPSWRPAYTPAPGQPARIGWPAHAGWLLSH